MNNFVQFCKELLQAIFPRPNYDTPVVDLPMNTPAPDPMTTLGPWDTPTNCRHNIRVIADQEGMTTQQKNDFSSTLHCESGWDNTIVMYNCVNGFVRSTKYDATIHGAILSKDVGICQINTYWHIGPGKDFPSEDYVLQNPEAVVRWAARVFKNSPNTWVCYSKGMYQSYAA
jgi:hypothetical protein